MSYSIARASASIYVCIFLLIGAACSHKGTEVVSMDTTQVTIHINRGLERSLGTAEKEIIRRWGQYLSTRDSFYYRDSPLWSGFEKMDHLIPDFELHSLCYRTKKFTAYRPSILSIQRIDSTYIVKTAFVSNDSVPDILAVFNVTAIKESGEYVFHRYNYFFGKRWSSRKINTITYFYDSAHRFDQALAEKQDAFNVKTAALFGIEHIPLRYYLFQNTVERLREKGYDFDINMFETIQHSAEVDLYNNIIYAANGTEYYPHEIVHFYVNAKFKNNTHTFINEGIATLLGGNINTLEDDIQVLKQFTQANPEFNYGELTRIRKGIGATNIGYAVGALLCREILNKGGWTALNTVLGCGNTDQALYDALTSSLGVSKSELNDYVHQLIMNAK